jgi:hypothetical protein
LDLSYPTLRGRLDKIIEHLRTIAREKSPEEILSDVQTGAATAEQAIEQLKKMA